MQLCITLPNQIFGFVQQYCKNTDISASAFCREAVIRRLEDFSLISTKVKEGEKSGGNI